MSWKNVKLGEMLTESKIESVQSDPDRRITVRLNFKGVEKRPFEKGIEGGTKYYVRKAGQFIYGKQNLFKGAFGLVPDELDGYESSQDIPTFDIQKKCLPEWLIYFFRQGNFYQSLESIATGTGSRRIQPSRLFDVEIPLPSLHEQRELIIKIHELEKKYKVLDIELDQQQTYLQLLRQTILQEAVQGKLTKQDTTDKPATELLKHIKGEKEKLVKAGKLKQEKELPPITEDETFFELPKGWVWCRLGEIFIDLKYGTSQKCDYKKAKHAVLRIPNLSKGIIDLEDLKFANLPEKEFSNLKLEVDDMLVIRSNGSENLVGRTAVFKGAEFDCAYAGYLMRLCFHKNLLCADYIHQVLESRYIRQLIELPLRTTSGVKNINSTEVSKLLIPLPPLAEQQRIVAKVQQLQQQLSQLEVQAQQSRKYAQQLLQSVLKEAFERKGKVYEMEEDTLNMVAEE